MTGDFFKTLIYDFLYFHKSSTADTTHFKDLKHNADLVPKFNDKLNEIIDHFERYHTISYDIQGVRDCGIDVLVKYDLGDDQNIIGIQIKSYDDLEEKDWASKLKAQMFEVIRAYGDKNLKDMYIAFCTDLIKHKDKIRNATADIATVTGVHIHIVEPRYARYFIDIPEYEIGSYLKKKLSEDDPVVIDSKECVEGLTFAQSAMVIEAVLRFTDTGSRFFGAEDVVQSHFVTQVYNEYPNVPVEIFSKKEREIKKALKVEYEINEANDFEALCCSSFFYMSMDAEGYELLHDNIIPLLSLIYEAKARFHYDDEETKWYMLDLLKGDHIQIINEFGPQS